MKYKNLNIHKSSEVQTKYVGSGTTIWQNVVILSGARIGRNVNICAHCFIENDVTIGDNVTIKSGVYIWNGTTVNDNVFIGPNVTFTNDKYPRSKNINKKILKTLLHSGCSIGGGTTILPGIVIGKNSLIGAGSVVTKSIPPYAMAKGSPAKIYDYIDNDVYKNKKKNSKKIDTIKKNKISNYYLKELKTFKDLRGELSVGNFTDNIPFYPKRYFFIYGVPSKIIRGEHAHLKCKQFIICITGKCIIEIDDSKSKKKISLDSPKVGCYLPPLTWSRLHSFSKNAVILTFASHAYDEKDYIRTYSEYVKYKNSYR